MRRARPGGAWRTLKIRNRNCFTLLASQPGRGPSGMPWTWPAATRRKSVPRFCVLTFGGIDLSRRLPSTCQPTGLPRRESRSSGWPLIKTPVQPASARSRTSAGSSVTSLDTAALVIDRPSAWVLHEQNVHPVAGVEAPGFSPAKSGPNTMGFSLGEDQTQG